MEKIKEEEIPGALLKWVNNESDLWLFRFTRSIGYTFEEIANLAKNNEDIKKVVDFVTESLLEKTIHRVADGSFTPSLAFYIFRTYLIRINNLMKDDKKNFIEINLTPDPDFDDIEEEENDENK